MLALIVDGVKFISNIVGNLVVLHSVDFLDGTGVATEIYFTNK